jgi:hypothetical protein
MRANFIKLDSYTQHKAGSLLDAKAEVLQYAKLSYDQHEALMFEYGCLFAEKALIGRSDQKKVLQMPAYGFWMWWRFKWAIDDEGLLNTDSFLDKKSYSEMKAYMITSPLLKDQFLNMLIHS